MAQVIRNEFFSLENDNVYFRGVDSGKLFEGYRCPLFNFDMGKMVAKYLSTGGLSIIYDNKINTFVVEQGTTTTALPSFEIESEKYFGFFGWMWTKEED